MDKATLVARVEVAFDQPALTAKLPGLFERGLWDEQALRCLGCGACAYVCPTCACFDIQEEADPRQAMRLRCWDSCGFSMFTLHASGHNPRATQSAALAPARLPQVQHLPRAPREAGLRGLRQVHPGLPGGHEPEASTSSAKPPRG